MAPISVFSSLTCAQFSVLMTEESSYPETYLSVNQSTHGNTTEYHHIIFQWLGNIQILCILIYVILSFTRGSPERCLRSKFALPMYEVFCAYHNFIILNFFTWGHAVA
jgi:hypothetical protein